MPLRVRSAAAMPSPAFLKLALQPHRGALLTALRKSAFVSSVHLELPVVGVPGVGVVALFVWPEPLGRTRRIAVDVVRLDATTLETAVQFTYELRPEERPLGEDEPPVIAASADPKTVRVEGPEATVVWYLVDLPGLENEVQRLETDGSPVFVQVDTEVYCYRLTCSRCGRARFSKPNSLHQIHLCRVCTRMERLRRRALVQYKARHGKKRERERERERAR